MRLSTRSCSKPSLAMSTKPTPALDASQQLATLDKHAGASEKPAAVNEDKPLNANDVHTIIVRGPAGLTRLTAQTNRLFIVVPALLLGVFVAILDQARRRMRRHGLTRADDNRDRPAHHLVGSRRYFGLQLARHCLCASA